MAGIGVAPHMEAGMRTRILSYLIALVFAGGGAVASAQTKEFPTRPVRLVVPVPPGGSIDVMARIVSPKWGELMGQNVIIDYRPGANTIVGSELVARSPADGYTLLINTLPFVVNPSLYPKMPFDTERDFAPVSMLGSSPFVLVVHPSVPAKSVKELIALAKAYPGKLNYSSAGNGSNLHVAAELFKNLTDTNIVHVPYGGGGAGADRDIERRGECKFSLAGGGDRPRRNRQDARARPNERQAFEGHAATCDHRRAGRAGL